MARGEGGFLGYPRDFKSVRRSAIYGAELAAIKARRKRLGRGFDHELTGLSLSGGGIRSASVSLGALQALDRVRGIDKIDYLSSVSGGGYIGCCLTAAMQEMNGAFPFTHKGDYEDTTAVRHIRDHSKYLIPRGAEDVIIAAAIFMRGILANIFLVIPILLFGCWLTLACRPSLASLSEPKILWWAPKDVLPAWALSILLPISGSNNFWLSFLVVLVGCAFLMVWILFGAVQSTPFNVTSMARWWRVNVTGPLSGGWLGRTWAGRAFHALYLKYLRRFPLLRFLFRGSYTPVSLELNGVFPLIAKAIFLLICASAFFELQPLVLEQIHAAYVRAKSAALLPTGEGLLDLASRLLSNPMELIAAWISKIAPVLAPLASLAALFSKFLLSAQAPQKGQSRTIVLVKRGLATATLWLAAIVIPSFIWYIYLELTYMGLKGTGTRSDSSILSDMIGMRGDLPDVMSYLKNALYYPFSEMRMENNMFAVNDMWLYTGLALSYFFIIKYLLKIPAFLAITITICALIPTGWLSIFQYMDMYLISIVEIVGFAALLLYSPLRLVILLLYLSDRIYFPDNFTKDEAGFALQMLLISVFIVDLINTDTTSFFRFYRDSLSRAFLFKKRDQTSDQLDDNRLLLHRIDTSLCPYPLINATLNLQGSRFANKRGRNADFFMFSPEYVGSLSTGYVGSKWFWKLNPRFEVADAMAISGAAVAPNMGAATIKALVPSLALLNVRLGSWVKNPLLCDSFLSKVQSRRLSTHPVPSLSIFIRNLKLWPLRTLVFERILPKGANLWLEMLSLIDEKSPEIYLTDGGNIENLGIFELLRRRCKLIIAIDAEADPSMTFGSFMNLIRFARTDLGARIDLPWEEIHASAIDANAAFSQAFSDHVPVPMKKGMHCAVCDIEYSFNETGLLVYFKSSMSGDENDVVLDYKRRHPDFPHEDTADQFFGEQQFEAYRSLGFHMVREVLEGTAPFAVRPKPNESLAAARQRVMTQIHRALS